MPKFREPSIGAYYDEPPAVATDGHRSWVTRARNFAIVYTEAKAGAKIAGDFADEHFLYMVDGHLRIAAGGEQAELEGESLAIVPPGASEIAVLADGVFVQVVTDAEAIVALAPNAAAYADGAPEVTPTQAWPEPVGGYRLRAWALPEVYASGGMVNAFRTRKLMVAPYPRFPEPRDETKLTPHSHEDFEQASVALEGEWVHHLRVPWTANRQDWRADEDIEIGSPSTTIIPAGVIHTSRGVTGEGWVLLDVFGPPRVDFSLRPGAVRNAEDYPMPAEPEPA
ncbi:MAG: hypothetical protein WDN24_16700 [Sphingomonas sp.]